MIQVDVSIALHTAEILSILYLLFAVSRLRQMLEYTLRTMCSVDTHLGEMVKIWKREMEADIIHLRKCRELSRSEDFNELE